MKKIVILFVFILFLFLSFGLSSPSLSADKCVTDKDCSGETPACQDGKCVKARALEIVYPQIPCVAGSPCVPTPRYVTTGLPDYINYLFRLAVIVIGIVILGAFTYSGVNYLLSFGNPAKLSDAKQGIFAAVLGGLILLGSYIVFRTINPQLVIMEVPDPALVKAYVVPGVYLCNYNTEDTSSQLQKQVPGFNLEQVLNDYMIKIPDFPPAERDQALKTRSEAAQKLTSAMGKAGDPQNCFLKRYSGPLTNFVIKKNLDSNKPSDWTVFIVPAEIYDVNKGEYFWKYDYGLVLHETDKFGNRCKLLPEPQQWTNEKTNAKIYLTNDNPLKGNFHPKMSFTANSITIFEKPATEPPPEKKGVILFEGPAFNEIGVPKEEQPMPPGYMMRLFSPFLALAGSATGLAAQNFKPAQVYDIKSAGTINYDIKFVSAIELTNKNLYQNTRSMQIDPKDGYIALIGGDEDKKNINGKPDSFEECAVIKTDDTNLTASPIGKCGQCSILWYINPLNWRGLKCYPCIKSMYVIKGQAL